MDPVVLITDDERGIALAVADRLTRLGRRPVVVRMGDQFVELDSDLYSADLTDPQGVADLVELLRQQRGPLVGVVHILPLKAGPALEEMDLTLWRHRLRLEVKSLFYLARAAGPDLKRTTAGTGGWLLAATAMGGSFASNGGERPFTFFPGHGGIAGLVKTLALEWPTVWCKAVDMGPEEPPAVVANRLFGELAARDGQAEVGYAGARRLVIRPRPASLDPNSSSGLAIDSSWVVLVTGGARGITAEAARTLAARYQPTLVLVGRSPLPPESEPPETAGLDTPQTLRAALTNRLRDGGQRPTPAQVEAACARVLQDREIRRNLAALRQAGARVAYHAVDVQDATAFGAVIDGIYQAHGRLDGVIHGAGLIEDRLLEDKTPESFDRVFGTKVDGAFTLSRTLRPDSLKFLLFFSSVAGRFGSRGQGDYAAANEVLNKLAVYLDHRWPARVVAINWGPWAKTGMVSAEVERQFAQRGVQLIPPSAGCRMLDEELRYGRKGETEVVIGGGPWWTEEAPQPGMPAAALPLLEGIPLQVGSSGAVELIRTLDPARDRYLLDHRLDGKPVMPAAMAVELMAEVAQKAWPDLHVVGVRSLRVLRGIVLEDGPKTLRVVARPQTQPDPERLELEVSVEIRDLDHPAHLHYRATVRLADRLPDPPPYQAPARIDWREFPLSVEEAYRSWLFHGPSFQGISRIHGVGAQGIAATVLPSSPRQCLQGVRSGHWLFDPVVVDSGPQLAILWARARQDMTALPSGIRAVTRFHSFAGSPLSCVFEVLPGSSGNTVLANVFFVGSDGRLRGMLEELECTGSHALNRLAGCASPVRGGDG